MVSSGWKPTRVLHRRICGQLQWWHVLQGLFLFLAIKLKSKRLAECRKRAFGGVSLGRLERNIMDLARRTPAAFARAMAFSNDRSLHRHAP